MRQNSRSPIGTASQLWHRRQHTIVAVVPVFLLIGIGLLLLPLFRYQINPDATSYITIAEKYADGNFQQAINGYWGPAISWLLAICIKLGAHDMLLTAKLLALATSGAILLLLNLLLARLNVAPRFRWFALIPAVFLLLDWSLPQAITPDLLFAAAFCLLVLRSLYFLQEPTRVNAIWLGVCSALLYAAKPVGFYFACVHFAVIALLLWRGTALHTKSTRDTAIKVLPAVAVFVALVSPWIAVLSLKYDRPTIATAASFNHALVGPAYFNYNANPLVTQVLPPSNATAVSSWEDPSYYTLPDWSPFDSLGAFWFSIGQLIRNAYDALTFLNKAFLIGSALLIGIVLLSAHRIVKRRWRFDNLDYVVLTTLLLLALYVPLILLERYVYAAELLVLVAGLAALVPFAQKILTRTMALILFVILCAGVLQPVATDMYKNKDEGKNIARIANVISPALPPNSKLVSNNLDALYVSYHTDWKFYGIIPTYVDTQTALDITHAVGVSYYLFFGDLETLPPYLQNAQLITSPDASTHLFAMH